MITFPHRSELIVLRRSALNVVRRSALILTGVALALAAIALPVQAASSRSASTKTRWRIDATITAHGRSVSLLGIDAVSRTDAWAAGIIGLTSTNAPLTALIEHWNGRAWRRSAVPAKAAATLTSGSQFLDSIAASSAANVWAFSDSGAYLRLSRSGWQPGSLPRRLARRSVIVSANVFSPADVWVFGIGNDTAASESKLTSFAARFNGGRWSSVRMPGHGTGFVSALSRTDMWAITGEGLSAKHTLGPRVARWNGKSWQLTAVQPKLATGTELNSIFARSNRDVWVAGSVRNAKRGTSPLAEHWNGRVWRLVSPSTTATSADIVLSNLVADGSGGIWATSTDLDGTRASFWHYANGVWRAVRLRRGWRFPELAAVPHSTSTWATTGFTARQGLILLHGPVPR
jgi:hypothetical protein